MTGNWSPARFQMIWHKELPHCRAVQKCQPRNRKAYWADAASRQNSEGKWLHRNSSQSTSSLSCSPRREWREADEMCPMCLLGGWAELTGLCSAVQLGAQLRIVLKGKQGEPFLSVLARESWADKNFLKITVRLGCRQSREDSDYFHLA